MLRGNVATLYIETFTQMICKIQLLTFALRESKVSSMLSANEITIAPIAMPAQLRNLLGEKTLRIALMKSHIASFAYRLQPYLSRESHSSLRLRS